MFPQYICGTHLNSAGVNPKQYLLTPEEAHTWHLSLPVLVPMAILAGLPQDASYSSDRLINASCSHNGSLLCQFAVCQLQNDTSGRPSTSLGASPPPLLQSPHTAVVKAVVEAGACSRVSTTCAHLERACLQNGNVSEARINSCNGLRCSHEPHHRAALLVGTCWAASDGLEQAPWWLSCHCHRWQWKTRSWCCSVGRFQAR
jgi:hypothetical protein